MKKFIFLVALIIIGKTGFSQEVGVRFGDVLGNSVAVDGIFNTGKFNRLHADVSFGDGVGVELLWDFLYRPLSGEAFRWYVGAGVSTLIDDPFWLGVSAEAGLEYRFNKIPLSLSADWRPTFYFIDETDFHSGGFGINARWIFGSSTASTDVEK